MEKKNFNYNKVNKSKDIAKDIPEEVIVKNEPEVATEEPKPAKNPKGVVNSPLNLREHPRKDAAILTVMPANSQVIIEEETNGFYKVKYNGFEGFAMAQFINKK